MSRTVSSSPASASTRSSKPMSRLTPVTSSAGRGASRRNWWSAQMPSASPLKISYDFAMLSDSERRLILRSPRPMRLASSLAVAYLLVIAYASLQPFTGWWIPPEEIRQFLTARWPRYITRRRRHGQHRRVRAAGISAGALVHAPRAAPARRRARDRFVMPRLGGHGKRADVHAVAHRVERRRAHEFDRRRHRRARSADVLADAPDRLRV